MTATVSISGVQSLLDARIPPLAEEFRVPGLQVAVQHSGRTEAVEFGRLSHTTGPAVTRKTAFPIGSITKLFTATAAMVLVSDGDLDLDEPIGGWLPTLDDQSARLTLRQLLSHTSGLGSGAVPGTVSTVSPGRYVADHCRRQNVVLPPGAGFSYSNTGYVVVGHLIEIVTGMSFWEAMESILLEPLGIDPAFVSDPRPRPPARPLASGYSVNVALNRIRPVDQSLAPAEAPAGALAISAVDLVTLGQVHIGAGPPGLLSAAGAEEMRRPVPGADPIGLAAGWGLGVAVYGSGDTNWYGHDGNSNGVSCYLRLNQELGTIIAFTSNANTGSDVWRALLAELADEGLPVERPVTWPTEPLATPPQECVGVYDNGDVAYVVKLAEDGQLMLAVDGAVFAQVACQVDLSFALRMPTTGHQQFCGRFLRDPTTGQIDRIQVSGRLARRRMTGAHDRDQVRTSG